MRKVEDEFENDQGGVISDNTDAPVVTEQPKTEQKKSKVNWTHIAIGLGAIIGIIVYNVYSK